MTDVFICDAIRTPVGRYGGGLAAVRADDLAAVPLRTLLARNPGLDPAAIEDVILGCANQSGEDNRNVARMALLLAGIPPEVPGLTVNRLCSSGLNAVSAAANAIVAGEADLLIAGGVESMSRAPFVIGKANGPYDRSPKMEDTTMGWRFVNPVLDRIYGTETMPKTAENLAEEFGISREDQDAFALWSQQKAATAQADGSLAEEIVPVEVPRRKQDPLIADRDEHPRQTSLEKLAALRPLFPDGTITAGNASGINDGAAALIVASAKAVEAHGLAPLVRVVGTAYAGVPPRTMGYGPVPATRKVLRRLGLGLDDFDLIELNEAFAAQALTCLRELGLDDDDPRINPLGGAIALGHPLGMSGARLAVSAIRQLGRNGGRRALCTMCVGVGQGVATVIERV
ncbi:MAG: 3-oxoadipyl-CoA thiolase [Xanthomonadales bacterium]|nr:3-oxoadipyl-CoA thiolase [Gammaproteobacteria bacterium]NNJ79909.1 3-oxoadipyl-CoA thiolase [Xanthomonadales bacterium]MBT8049569.1 3-oxoadipyl-CoA thiolase [Gammaproteobacteria bacterium]MBT8056539.1 3-oxoadipyl-CoA thiolase [Gammaproteobacteria bacterium]NNK38606.1 3-oxoadipyl-CoA thiolase [Xanthomonadales bacterium]